MTTNLQPERLEQAKDAILDVVRRKNHVSFVELEDELESKNLVSKKEDSHWRDEILCPPPFTNVVMWSTSNELLSEAMISLLNEKPKRLFMKLAHIIIYGADGGFLNLPILKAGARKNPKEKSWIPLVFSCEKTKGYM
jgi:hypothetical protein